MLIKIFRGLIIGFVLMLSGFSARSQTLIGEPICGDNAEDKYGEAIALSSDGSVLAVGALYHENPARDQGQVKVYIEDGDQWSQMGQTLLGAQVDAFFGSAVELSADGLTLAVGSYGYRQSFNEGLIDLYQWENDEWVPFGQIPGRGNFRVGRVISLSSDGQRIAVGYKRFTWHSYKVFEFNGTEWIQMGLEFDDRFSNSAEISADGNRLALGVNGGGGLHGVRVYEWDDGTWTKIGESVVVEFESGSSTTGVCLNATGDIVAFGDRFGRTGGSFSGSMFIYAYNGTDWQAVGNPIHGEVSDLLGADADLSDSGTRLAVHGSRNSVNGQTVEVFEYQEGVWTQTYDLNEDGGYGRGLALSRNGNRLAVGSPWDDCNGYESGKARVYQLDELSSIKQKDEPIVKIYPNPAADILFIEGLEIDLIIYISDFTGILHSTRILNENEIDLSHLPPGVYSLAFTKDGVLFQTRRFIKH